MDSDSAMFEPLELSHSVIDHWEKNCSDLEKVDEKLTDLERLAIFYGEKSSFSELHSDLIERYAAYVAKHCESMEATKLRQKELELMKIMLRDRNRPDLSSFSLLASALLQIVGLKGEERVDGIESTVLLEAEKCLINLAFNSQRARIEFRNSSLPLLTSRIKHLHAALTPTDASLPESLNYLRLFKQAELAELLFYDLKLAFIMSANERAVQSAWLDDSDAGVLVFLGSLKQSTEEYAKQFEQPPLQRSNEALQTLFNIYCHAKVYDLAVAQQVADECVRIIENRKYPFELHQNSIHLMSLVSCNDMERYCPEVLKHENKAEPSLINEGRDIRFVKSLLDIFEKALDINFTTQPRLLGTYFRLLINLCTQVKAARRYCRLKIIPPLTAKEVEKPPEEGDELRNKLVRLIKENSGVQELSAEFLFVLCKRSVNRLVKYCGFGHAAGLLANYGFLAQAMAGKRSNSDSESSETEEYKEVEEKINPVTGYIPPGGQAEALQKMFDEMSDEQKEYEAIKLAEAMSKLMDEGIFTPATVDESGKPKAVSHVLELVQGKEAKEEEENSDDD